MTGATGRFICSNLSISDRFSLPLYIDVAVL